MIDNCYNLFVLLRPRLDRAFKIALAMGMPTEDLSKGAWMQYTNGSRRRQQSNRVNGHANTSVASPVSVIEPKTAAINSKLITTIDTKETPVTKIPSHKKFNTSPTRMDKDVATRRVNHLYDLAQKYHENYVLELISADCNQPSQKALSEERKVFYKLFGVTPNEKDCLADQIAHDIGFFSPEPTLIINGLIKYFEGLARFIASKKANLEQKAPALLKRYIRYAVHEVYGLINSISKKITVPNLQDIKNEELFPMVSKFITNALGNLKPIEF